MFPIQPSSHPSPAQSTVAIAVTGGNPARHPGTGCRRGDVDPKRALHADTLWQTSITMENQ